MNVVFTKMHGLGNDFVVVEAGGVAGSIDGTLASRLADRRLGVGCDQVLVIEPARGPQADLMVQVFNADGSAAGQCGNGMRCVAAFALARGLAAGPQVVIEVGGRRVVACRMADQRIRVDMGIPEFEPSAVPFQAAARAVEYDLDLGAQRLRLGVVSMGNPHALLWVDDVAAAPVAEIGRQVQRSAAFPAGVNVGFATALGRDRMRLRVFERGVGETCACGSGACAAVAIARDQGRVDERVVVELPGGELEIDWPGGGALTMTGPAANVFSAEIEL